MSAPDGGLPPAREDLTEADRSGMRDRALNRTLGSGAVLQIVTLVGALATLPVLTRTLSPAEYGVLAALTSASVVLGVADFGVGSALTSRLAESEGARADAASRDRLVSSALAAAVGSSALVVAAGLALTLLLPWRQVLGAPDVSEGLLRAAVLVLTLSTAVSIVGSLGQRALYGIQQGSAANLWLIGSALASALGSVMAALLDGRLWVLVLAALGGPAALSLLCGWWTLRRTSLRCHPRPGLVTFDQVRDIAGTGGWFLVISLATVASYQTDVLVVAAVVGAPAAAVYSVALRVFGLLTASAYPALVQLWPAFTEALARGDLRWVRTRFWRATWFAFAASLMVGAGLVVAGPWLVSNLLNPDLEPPRSLLVALALWTCTSLTMSPLLVLMNAAGLVREHALMSVAVAVVNLPLSILLAHRIGIAGPVCASLISSVLFAALPAAMLARSVLRSGLVTARPLPRPD